MKVKIKKSVQQEVTIDVDFPVYRRQVVADAAVFTRILEYKGTMRKLTIWISGSDVVQIDLDLSYRFDCSSHDFLLGKGKYACTREDFQVAYDLARQSLSVLFFNCEE